MVLAVLRLSDILRNPRPTTSSTFDNIFAKSYDRRGPWVHASYGPAALWQDHGRP